MNENIGIHVFEKSLHLRTRLNGCEFRIKTIDILSCKHTEIVYEAPLSLVNKSSVTSAVLLGTVALYSRTSCLNAGDILLAFIPSFSRLQSSILKLRTLYCGVAV